MKFFNKKVFVGITAAAMIAGGSAMLLNLDTVHAAPQDQTIQRSANRQQRPPKFNLNDMAAKLAEKCNVSADEIISYCNNGGNFRDAQQAARLAKLSGKSFKDVAAAKTDDNRWEQVAESLGVTRQQMKADMDSDLADRMAERGDITASVAMQLLQEGYEVRDIDRAAALAKASGKDVHDVLNMKKTNNRWSDVAKELGVDESTLKKDRPEKPEGNRHHGRPGRGEGCPGAQEAEWCQPGPDFDADFNLNR